MVLTSADRSLKTRRFSLAAFRGMKSSRVLRSPLLLPECQLCIRKRHAMAHTALCEARSPQTERVLVETIRRWWMRTAICYLESLHAVLPTALETVLTATTSLLLAMTRWESELIPPFRD